MNELLELLQSYEISGIPAYQWGLLALILLVIGAIIFIGKNRFQSHHDSDLYEKSKNYLNNIDEYTRKPLPLLMFLILIILVVAEALGFSYVFTEYILPDAKQKTYEQAAFILAIVISFVLVKMTHVTGADLYYNQLAGKINNSLKMEKDTYDYKTENKHVHVDNTYDDKDSSDVTKMINRMTTSGRSGIFLNKRRVWIVATFIFIIVIALTAYFVRENTYKTHMIDEMYSTDKIGMTFEDKDAKEKVESSIPAFMQDAVNSSEEVQHEGKILAKQKANSITYFMLSFLFLAIQCIGIYAGFNWGFVGKESNLAYKNIKGYKK